MIQELSPSSEEPLHNRTTERATKITENILKEICDWYEKKRNSKGNVNTNVMAAGLYMTEHLKKKVPLFEKDYLTDSQVKGAGGSQAKAILQKHGESRKFTSEGGRTSRRTRAYAIELAEIINRKNKEVGIDRLGEQERKQVAFRLQNWFVKRIQEDYFDKQQISVEIDPGKPVRKAVEALVRESRKRGGTTAGAVAQHLVGAKLALRFPEQNISNESYTTADFQTNRAGDFQVGDTAIHVTVSPTEKLFSERCKENIYNGFRPRVLVPEDRVAAAFQLAEVAGVSEHIAIQSIEDFVGTNIEEIAIFSTEEIRLGLKSLLLEYNKRVEEAESDTSLKIEIPTNL